MPEGAAPDGSGVPVLAVFRVKNGTLARILKFTLGPLELWALNSSPKDSALRRALTQELGSLRARQIPGRKLSPWFSHLTDRTPRPYT